MTPEEEEAQAWLLAFYEKTEGEGRSDRQDRIYDSMDGALSEGRFAWVEDIMEHLDLSRVSISETLSFLTTSRWGHGRAPIPMLGLSALPKVVQGYPAFFARVEVYLRQVDPARVEALLKGLEPKSDAP